MSENLLIQSQKAEVKLKKVLCIFLVFYLVMILVAAAFSESIEYVLHPAFFINGFFISLMLFSPVLIVNFYFWIVSHNQLVVTDKRISGKSAFGKQVDLPIDSVSSVSTVKLIKGLSISTASGKVSFWAISNRDAIYKVISDLIIARQNRAAVPNIVPQPINTDYTEELKKIKQLLDTGVITQEEFDAKKKQLLGL